MRKRDNQNEARKARKEEELELKTETGHKDPTPQEAVHNIIVNRDKKKSLIALRYRYLVSEGALVGAVNSIQLKEKAFRDLFVEFERKNFTEEYDEIYAENEDMTFFALVHKAEIMEGGEDA